MDHVTVRRRLYTDPVDVAFRLEPAESQSHGPVLISAWQAQDIVNGLARLGVVALLEP